MARQRFIWPDIWSDPVLGRLPALELVFYIGCFSNADDEGRLIGDPAYLRSTIFPYHEHSNRKIRTVRDAVIEKVNSLSMYEAAGVEYLVFSNWRDWQKPKYPTPSKLPIPPDLPESSPNLPEGLPEDSPMGWVGLGRDGMGGVGLEEKPSLTGGTETAQLESIDAYRARLLQTIDEARPPKAGTA
jgi:hypothetical protein